ncbi:hypothetical protein EYF88_13490 [Paracoccus sediminis]|uniref:Uncharacterized protein n=1 Tax=Paracoccus sediminis TaxID=1214787 RepID=A0A238XIA8_9RHOB|nr:hypothetical protein [Paracoccus sediminis]TBN48512.1 hypothetical protein EYF88_13490 [Paracoccus sediminis]SNR58301.1 hypothetical protein SAMN06265378_11053 [Paracoccus sediminis]
MRPELRRRAGRFAPSFPNVRVSAMVRFSAVLATSLVTISAAWAQTPPAAVPSADPPRAVAGAPATPEERGQSGEGDCPAPDTVAQPATAPQPGADSTDANNSGSSGWSGGLGGSQLGTNAQGALPASPTWQPPTARGLDLTGRAEPVAVQAVATDC